MRTCGFIGCGFELVGLHSSGRVLMDRRHGDRADSEIHVLECLQPRHQNSPVPGAPVPDVLGRARDLSARLCRSQAGPLRPSKSRERFEGTASRGYSRPSSAVRGRREEPWHCFPTASPVPYKSLRLLAVCTGSIGPGLIGDVDPEDSGVVYERDTCVGVSMTWISSPAVEQVVWGACAGVGPPEKNDARNMLTHRPSAAMYLLSQR